MPIQFCCLCDLVVILCDPVELDQIVVFIQSRIELHTLGDPILFHNLIAYRNLSLGSYTTCESLHFVVFVAQRFEWKADDAKVSHSGKLFVAVIQLPCRARSTREHTGAHLELHAFLTKESMLFSYIFHILRYPLRHESHIFCSLCAQQLLSDFVLGLRTSSDVFCSFRRLILRQADDCLEVNFAMDSGPSQHGNINVCVSDDLHRPGCACRFCLSFPVRCLKAVALHFGLEVW
jgi:hypothetical protein